jgi:hypothetical protein
MRIYENERTGERVEVATGAPANPAGMRAAATLAGVSVDVVDAGGRDTASVPNPERAVTGPLARQLAERVQAAEPEVDQLGHHASAAASEPLQTTTHGPLIVEPSRLGETTEGPPI